MPVTILDLVVIAVVLISAVLAMFRGFTREVLSIGSWAIAAIVAYVFYPQALPYAKQFISNPTVALIAAIAAVFLLTLFVAYIITSKLSDVILDSRIGPLDRTLGFLFGAARGFLLAVVAYSFLIWLMPKDQPPQIKDSKFNPILKSSSEKLLGYLPKDLEENIFGKIKLPEMGGTAPASSAPVPVTPKQAPKP